jgi:hypothetical protein
VLRGRFRPAASGRYLIGASGVGRLTLSVDGAVLADAVTPVPADPVEAMTRPGEIRAVVTLAEGQQPENTLEFSGWVWPGRDVHAAGRPLLPRPEARPAGPDVVPP